MENVYYFSIFDILPYFVLLFFLLTVYGGNLRRPLKARYCFWAIFILAAIRYGVAYDYFSYRSTLLGEGGELSLDRYEPFSRILAEIGCNTHYQFFFAIGSFLTIYPIYKVCLKYSLDPSLSLIIYYLHPSFYLDGLGIVRNAIAFSFVLYAFVVLEDNNKMKSFLLLICAVLFHKSAFIGLFIYFIKYFPRSQKFYIFFYALSFFISGLIASVIGEYASQLMLVSDAQRYIEGGADRSGGGTMTIIVNGICIINLIVWNKFQGEDNRIKYFFSSYCIGACLWNIFLPVDVVLAGRLSVYFTLPLILIAPYYIFVVKNKKTGKKLVFSFFVLLFVSHFYINIKSYLEHPSKMSTIPYQTIFWHTDYRNLM